MANRKWSELYRKLPQNRREAIEARVAGELARYAGKAYNTNPFSFEPDGYNHLFRAWRDGYYDADEAILSDKLSRDMR